MLTLYIGAFPLFWARSDDGGVDGKEFLARAWIALAAVTLRGVMNALRRRLGDEVEPAEGYDGEFVLLGLACSFRVRRTSITK